MLTYVDWTPGRWGRVRTELLRPCGLPALYLTARDVPARRVLRTLRRLRRAVYATAEELAHAARRLLLDVGAGQEDLSDYLRRRFGLCAGGASPDAEVCFGERKGSAPALYLGTGCRAQQPVEYALSAAYAPALGPLPPDGRLLCALFQAGKLPIAAIGVKSVQHNA